MRAYRGISWVVLLALVAGCGGSGSSGFDPSGLEAPLIEQAIAEQRCVQGDGSLLICPAGAEVQAPVGGVPGPGDIRVHADVQGAGGVACSAGAVSQCSLLVSVATDGLPPHAELRVAVRVLPDGRWQVGDPLEVESRSDGMADLAPVTVGPADVPRDAEAVQLAVLVFVPPSGEVPTVVDELRETGAGYAFVLPPEPITGASS